MRIVKKIAFVTRVLSSGGAEGVLARIVKGCVDRGMECLVIAVQPTEGPSIMPEGAETMVLSGETSLKGKLKVYRQVRRHVKEFGADVVLTMPEDIGIYALAGMLGSSIPVVVSERNNPWVMPYKKISRILRRLVYPFAKGLIFQTERAASFFTKGQQKKGIVLGNPLDLSRLPEVYTGQREKCVISAGRLDSQKNFPLLIKAFARFQESHPDYRLTIYGEGRERQALEALAASLLPEGSWALPGKVNDLPHRLAKCEMFALSSDFEGVPNVLIEAMAVGTPAVSTDCAPGGAAELISHGENGLLVPVGDEAALAEGLCRLADDRAAAMAMAEKATAIREKLDGEKVTAQWLAYLEKCAKG